MVVQLELDSAIDHFTMYKSETKQAAATITSREFYFTTRNTTIQGSIRNRDNGAVESSRTRDLKYVLNTLHVQTSIVVDSASYLACNGVISLWVKRPEREAL
jgi:hypothetical protein